MSTSVDTRNHKLVYITQCYQKSTKGQLPLCVDSIGLARTRVCSYLCFEWLIVG